MNWIIKKLHFISDEIIFKLKNKIFLFVFESGVFDKKIAFVFGKTDINHYEFGITLLSLFSIQFERWKNFEGYPYLTLNIALLGFSLFIACEDAKSYK